MGGLNPAPGVKLVALFILDLQRKAPVRLHSHGAELGQRWGSAGSVGLAGEESLEPGILGIAALNPCRRRCPALGEVFRFKSCCVLGDSHQCEGTDLDSFPVVGFGVWICLLFHCWAPGKGLGSSIPVMLQIPQLPPACFSSPTNPAVFSREMVDLWHCCILALEHRGVKVPESSLAGAGCPCASSCSPA